MLKIYKYQINVLELEVVLAKDILWQKQILTKRINKSWYYSMTFFYFYFLMYIDDMLYIYIYIKPKLLNLSQFSTSPLFFFSFYFRFFLLNMIELTHLHYHIKLRSGIYMTLIIMRAQHFLLSCN